METLQVLSIALGAAWASGINLYAVIVLIGGAGLFGVVDLPGELDVLSNPLVLTAAIVLYAIEFVADKVPGIDTLWDTVHTFIRIPAGALLAAGAVTDVAEPYQVVAALLTGALVAGGSHASKAGTRAVINTSPEPFSNWGASLGEDILVVLGLSLAIFKPVLFFIFFIVLLLVGAWLLPKIWRAAVRVLTNLRNLSQPARRDAPTRSKGFNLSLGNTDSEKG